MDKVFERDRARKEIIRLNVEIARLRTWIHDENQDFRSAILAVRESNQNLANEIETRARRRFRIHECLLTTLRTLKRIPGFTGTRVPGQSVERVAVDGTSSTRLHEDVNHSQGPDHHKLDDDLDIDAGEDRLDRVIETLDNML